MSFRNHPQFVKTYSADGEIPNPGLFVKRTGAGFVAVCNLRGEMAHGLAMTKANSGGQTTAAYAPSGFRCRSGEAIAFNDLITTDANGRGVKWRPGDAVLGVAREAVSGANMSFDLDLLEGFGSQIRFLTAHNALAAGEAVKLRAAATNTVEKASAAGEIVFGIALASASASAQVPVMTAPGVCQAIAGGNVAIGSQVSVAADAHLVNSAAAQFVIGHALSAGTNNNLMTVQLVGYFNKA